MVKENTSRLCKLKGQVDAVLKRVLETISPSGPERTGMVPIRGINSLVLAIGRAAIRPNMIHSPERQGMSTRGIVSV